MITLSFEWKMEDRHQWGVKSSVAAEPLAVIRAISFFAPMNKPTTVPIQTDHAPLIYAVSKR